METLSIFEQMQFSTTRIETQDSEGKGYSGTGFFFNYRLSNGDVVPLIITNKHVVEKMSVGRVVMTQADKNGEPMLPSYTVAIDEFEKRWLFHPDPEVDLCAFPLMHIVNFAKSKGVDLYFKAFDENLIPNKETVNSLDAVEDIYMVGYPNGLWDAVNNKPIVRKGITATDVKYDYNGKKEFVIDAASFPGSSGSPIFICNSGGYSDKKGSFYIGKSRIILLGVLYAGPQLTIAGDVKVVTIPTAKQIAVSVTDIPTNLGYVIKSNRILDFIPLINQKYNM